MGLKNLLYRKNELMDWADVLHADANSGKFKINNFCVFNFLVVVVINGHGALISDRMDAFSWFFVCSYIFWKAKSYFNSYWVGMVKYGCGLWGHGALKSAVSQEWIDKFSWFFACSYIVRKAKSYFNSYWVRIVKNDYDLLAPGALKSVVVFFFYNWDSFHAKLNSHYKAWSYKKKKHKKIKAYRKSV